MGNYECKITIKKKRWCKLNIYIYLKCKLNLNLELDMS